MRFEKCVLGVVVVVACLTGSMAFAGLEVIVATGDPAPDGNGFYSEFAPPTLSSTGQFAFLSRLSGTLSGEADSIGVFRRDATDVTQIVRTGELFLGEPIIGFFDVRFYIDKSSAIEGSLATGPPTTFHLFRGDGGPLANLVPSGSPSPSGNNELVAVLSQVVNEDGVQVYRALYSGVNQEAGLYERTPNGMVTTRLLDGSVAPRGGVLEGFGGRYTLNEEKQIATVASVMDGNETLNSLIRINSSNVDELVREGDLLADGITTIDNFGFRVPMINSNGAIAFSAEYEQPGLRPEGVFIADSSGTSLIAGRLLPGGPAAARDIEIFGFTDTQQIVFSANVGFGIDPDSAIYIADSTGVSLIALEDTSAPGTGKLFGEFPFNAATSNASGDIAFLADLADTLEGPTTGRALFRYTENDGLAPIVQTGDTLNGSIISQISYAGTIPNSATNNPDDSISGMNDSGQIAFNYTLADGQSGIALWSPDDISGDFDDDGDVDGADFLKWQRGEVSDPPSASDLADWEASFGNPGAPGLSETSTAVPEPASWMSLVFGMLALHFRRRTVVC